jgi:hypothetical protein
MTGRVEVPVIWLQALCLTVLRIVRLEAAVYTARQAVARLKEGTP